MDILGAIALGTEKYQKGAKFTRLARSKPRVLVLEHNWRQVIVHAVFQITIMLALMYFGQFMFFNGEGQEGPFNLVTPGEGRDNDRMKLDTICFHTFIIMNIFNMINCRVLDTAEHTEKNVFKTLCKFKMGCPPRPEHSIFWVVMAGEIFMQQLAITRFNVLFGTQQLTQIEQLICWLIGSLSLPINLIVKNVKVDNFGFVQNINLERVDPDEFINRFIGWFDGIVNKFSNVLSGDSNDNLEEKYHKLFMTKADGNDLVQKKSGGPLVGLLKQALEFEGAIVSDEEIGYNIEQADLKHDMVSFEEFMMLKHMCT